MATREVPDNGGHTSNTLKTLCRSNCPGQESQRSYRDNSEAVYIKEQYYSLFIAAVCWEFRFRIKTSRYHEVGRSMSRQID